MGGSERGRLVFTLHGATRARVPVRRQVDGGQERGVSMTSDGRLRRQVSRGRMGAACVAMALMVATTVIGLVGAGSADGAANTVAAFGSSPALGPATSMQ